MEHVSTAVDFNCIGPVRGCSSYVVGIIPTSTSTAYLVRVCCSCDVEVLQKSACCPGKETDTYFSDIISRRLCGPILRANGPVTAYELNPDPTHYTTKFIDGLQPGVRILVAIQQPRDLDTAYSLALLYEELGEECGPVMSEPPKFAPARRSYQPPAVVQPISPPPPPAWWVSPKVEEKRQAESQRITAEEKWQSLRAFRRARNLCFTCDDKYHREHKCKNTIPLHIVQEMVEYMHSFESEEPEENDQVEQQQQQQRDPHLMMLSAAALNTAITVPKTMLLKVQIQNQDLLFLVDSGSSSCFIDRNKAQLIMGSTALPDPVHVKVAGGAILSCAEYFPQLSWSAEGTEFCDDFKVLELGSYDGIIGLDRLGKYSPMVTHWEHGWIAVPKDGHLVVLQGEGLQFCTNALVELNLMSDAVEPDPLPIPPQVQAILDRFATVFATSTGLPPRRQCDHHIPLVPGARPVSMRCTRIEDGNRETSTGVNGARCDST